MNRVVKLLAEHPEFDQLRVNTKADSGWYFQSQSGIWPASLDFFERMCVIRFLRSTGYRPRQVPKLGPPKNPILGRSQSSWYRLLECHHIPAATCAKIREVYLGTLPRRIKAIYDYKMSQGPFGTPKITTACGSSPNSLSEAAEILTADEKYRVAEAVWDFSEQFVLPKNFWRLPKKEALRRPKSVVAPDEELG